MADTECETVVSKSRYAMAMAFAENACFALALAFLIPPVPSEAGQRYRPAYVLCATLMALSRLAAIYGKRESIWGAVAKIAVVIAVAWGVNMRVFGP